jgi:polyphosphate kinase
MESAYFNRELSWIEFNARVLSEGVNKKNKPLERLKFLSIVSSNFDEFFMVRVATIKKQYERGNKIRCPSGIAPDRLLDEITTRVKTLVAKQYNCLHESVLPILQEAGVHYQIPSRLNSAQKKYIRSLFREEILPVLTPVRLHMDEPFLSSGNLRLYAGFLLTPLKNQSETVSFFEKGEKEIFTIVQIPPALERILFLPETDDITFTLIEDVILECAQELFPGCQIQEDLLFRITRDADMSVDEERDEDFKAAMEEILINRGTSRTVRLMIKRPGSDKIVDNLVSILKIEPSEIYECPGPLNLGGLMELVFLQGFDHLRDDEWRSSNSLSLSEDEDIWESIKKRDILLHHPYDSFYPVIHLLKKAASDTDVMAIKMTLYRTSGDSPIIDALAEAAENGKQVTVLVELKARFDEKKNIGWANRLEKSGVIVLYGVARLKVHAKALLIIRRETIGITRYVHLGTGNYHDKTAKLYTDLGLLTNRDDLTYETALFFNAITGYSAIPRLSRLIMAPISMKNMVINLIEREALKSSEENPGKIAAKINSLADPEVIQALYKASRAGVDIQLNVRGICMLVPGKKGLSENIRVVSIIDRYLEHSRIFYFYNGGSEEIFCSSADWMPRNLERRVELMFPILDTRIKKRIKEMLFTFFRDNTNSHELTAAGAYKKITQKDKKKFRCQKYFTDKARERVASSGELNKKEFTVRRKPAEK